MPRIVIVDYGVGNIFSIKNSFEKIPNVSIDVSCDTTRINKSDALVLPGVGSYKIASDTLKGLKESLKKNSENGKIIFGICLGLQLFFKESEEATGSGLDLIDGKVKELPSNVKVPHMGWNTFQLDRETDLLNGLETDSFFYFNHSYYVDPNDNNVTIATTDYGTDFPAIIHHDNILGTQFHPEKSGVCGFAVINNLIDMIKR